jgi:hypothetical protein
MVFTFSSLSVLLSKSMYPSFTTVAGKIVEMETCETQVSNLSRENSVLEGNAPSSVDFVTFDPALEPT